MIGFYACLCDSKPSRCAANLGLALVDAMGNDEPLVQYQRGTKYTDDGRYVERCACANRKKIMAVPIATSKASLSTGHAGADELLASESSPQGNAFGRSAQLPLQVPLEQRQRPSGAKLLRYKFHLVDGVVMMRTIIYGNLLTLSV